MYSDDCLNRHEYLYLYQNRNTSTEMIKKIFIIGCLVVFLLPSCIHQNREKVTKESPQIDVESFNYIRRYSSGFEETITIEAKKFNYNGHDYISFHQRNRPDQGIVHDPDCKTCKTKNND